MATTKTSIFSFFPELSYPRGLSSELSSDIKLETLVSSWWITLQSRSTSAIGTGMYFLASIGIIWANCFSETLGKLITKIKLDFNGIETPQSLVFILDSLIKVTKALAISLEDKLVALPFSIFA